MTPLETAQSLPRYGDWSPTDFDPKGLAADDENGWSDWRVLPIMQTRDSDPLERSNYAAALATFKEIGEGYEETSFGHWGPGWFDLILIDPSCEKAMVAAGDLCQRIEDYPVLDEDDFIETEYEEACESWDWRSERDRIDIIRNHSRDARWRTFRGLREAIRGELPPDWGIQQYLNTP